MEETNKEEFLDGDSGHRSLIDSDSGHSGRSLKYMLPTAYQTTSMTAASSTKRKKSKKNKSSRSSLSGESIAEDKPIPDGLDPNRPIPNNSRDVPLKVTLEKPPGASRKSRQRNSNGPRKAPVKVKRELLTKEVPVSVNKTSANQRDSVSSTKKSTRSDDVGSAKAVSARTELASKEVLVAAVQSSSNQRDSVSSSRKSARSDGGGSAKLSASRTELVFPLKASSNQRDSASSTRKSSRKARDGPERPQPKRLDSTGNVSAGSLSAKSASSRSTNATYTSRVSKVSIGDRGAVLAADDPLSRHIDEKIEQAGGNSGKKEVKGLRNSLPIMSTPFPVDNANHSKSVLPMSIEEDNPKTTLVDIDKGVDIQEGSLNNEEKKSLAPVAMPPLPPLVEEPGKIYTPPRKSRSSSSSFKSTITAPTPPIDDFTYSDSEHDLNFREKGWTKRKKILVFGSIALLAVLGAAVGVFMALSGGSDGGSANNEASGTSAPETPAPSILRPTQPRPSQPTPTLSPASVAPVPTAGPIPSPPPTTEAQALERDIIELVSSLSPSTAESVQDKSSSQYRAVLWMVDDVQENSWSLEGSQNQIIQRFSLATFFYNTLGDQWRENDGWLETSLTECDWSGLSCVGNGFADATGFRRLQSFDMFDNRVDGALPHEISFLSNLILFDVGKNRIASTVPDVFDTFAALETLRLDQNRFVGRLPRSFGSLVALSELTFYDNSFVGNLDFGIGNLRGLGTLLGSNNRIAGTLPSELGRLNLQTLELFQNSLVGPIPSELGQQGRLASLLLSENQFTGNIPSEIGNLSRLETLDFFSNRLSGPLPSQLGQLDALEQLLLEVNRLTGTIPRSLGLLSTCKSIVMHENDLRGSIPVTFGNLVEMEILVLANNTLAGPVPAILGRLSNLQLFRVEGNELTGTMPAQICDLDTSVFADCGGAAPEVECSCCTQCFELS